MSKDKYIGTFVGLGPVSNPRFVMAIMIDEPLVEERIFRRNISWDLFLVGLCQKHSNGIALMLMD